MKKKFSLHSSMAHFALWLGAHQNTSSSFSQVVWALQHPAVPSSHTQHCPMPCSDVPPQPWHPGIASQQFSTGHLAIRGAADSPHTLPTASALPAAYPNPGFAPLSAADTLSKSLSPAKGALTSTSEPALHSRHQAQARAKQYQLSEVRWIYVAGHCRGWLSAGHRADKAKTLFMLALSRLQATSQDAKAHIPALRLSLPQQLVPEQ